MGDRPACESVPLDTEKQIEIFNQMFGPASEVAKKNNVTIDKVYNICYQVVNALENRQPAYAGTPAHGYPTPQMQQTAFARLGAQQPGLGMRGKSSTSSISVRHDQSQFKPRRPSKRLSDLSVGEIRFLNGNGKGIAEIIEHMEKERNIQVSPEKVGDIIDGKTYTTVGWSYSPSKTGSNPSTEESRRSIHEQSKFAQANTLSNVMHRLGQPPPPPGQPNAPT
jgi:hypothetical protein